MSAAAKDLQGATRWMFESNLVRVGSWACNPSGPPSAERSQDWPMASFVHAGAYLIRSAGAQNVVDTSTMVLIQPDQPYRTKTLNGLGSRGSSLAVSGDLLAGVFAERGLSEAQTKKRFAQLTLRTTSRLTLAERLLFTRLGEGGPPEPLAVEEAALGVLGQIVEHACGRAWENRLPRAGARKARRIVGQLTGVMAERYKERLLLRDLANAVGVSPYYLCHVFRHATDMAVHRYLNALRLQAALDRLMDDGGDLTQLALDVGYSSHSHFSAAFRREFGLPPSQFRRLASLERLQSARQSLARKLVAPR